jgi:hypothetical protein
MLRARDNESTGKLGSATKEFQDRLVETTLRSKIEQAAGLHDETLTKEQKQELSDAIDLILPGARAKVAPSVKFDDKFNLVADFEAVVKTASSTLRKGAQVSQPQPGAGQNNSVRLPAQTTPPAPAPQQFNPGQERVKFADEAVAAYAAGALGQKR